MHRQALKVYSHATLLPPADLESRAIIAKAYNRMGLTNAMLSRAKGDKLGPEPSLLSEAEANYRQSLALFEKLHAEFPTDPKVRRFYAESLGSWGWCWLLMAMNRTDEAKPSYERAVQLLCATEFRDASASDQGGAENRAKEGVTNVLSDLASLASTVYALAGILEMSGLAQEKQVTYEDNLTMISAYSPRVSQVRSAGSSGHRNS